MWFVGDLWWMKLVMIRRLIYFYNWVKFKLPDIIFYSGFIFVFTQIGAVLNFVTNLLIVPKYLSDGDLGLISPITQYVAFGALPLGIITSLVVKFVTRYEANGEWGKLKSLVRDLFVFGGISTVAVAVVFVVGYDSFALRMGIESKWIFFWMFIYLCVSSCLPVMSLLSRSMQQYFLMAVGGVLVPFVLMLFAIFLLPVYGIVGYIIALIASLLANLVLLIYALIIYFAPHRNKLEPYFDDCKEVIRKYLLLFSCGAGCGWLWGFVPPFVVKHFLSDADAAGYYMIQRLAQIPFYAFSSLMLILLPMLSIKHEKGQSTAATVKYTILYTVLAGGVVVIGLYLFTPWLFDFVPQWRERSEYAKYVWFLSISVVLGAVNSVLVTDLAAKWIFKPSWYTIPISFFVVTSIYCLFGWGAFRGKIPEGIWLFVNNHFQPGLYSLFSLMILNNLLTLPVNIYWYRMSTIISSKKIH
ncbi:MAG: hypothetical protein PHO37_08695 [Kiritimatiellae bacterium]|nr:hypothetical protein [Kiritimatiellia bacterium]